MSLLQSSEQPSPVGHDTLALGKPRWYAVQTCSRREKVVTAQLRDKGICTFLPLSAQVHHWSDRRKKVEVPLFPGYTFVHFSPRAEVCFLVLRTLGVVSFVGIHGRGLPIPDHEIEAIQTLIASKLRVEPHPFIKCGDWVRVNCGPLEGVEGILVRKKNVCSLVLSVEMLGRSAAVEVDASLVERVTERSGGPRGQKMQTLSHRTRSNMNPTAFAGQAWSISSNDRGPRTYCSHQGRSSA